MIVEWFFDLAVLSAQAEVIPARCRAGWAAAGALRASGGDS